MTQKPKMATRSSHFFGQTNEMLLENIWIQLEISCAGGSSNKNWTINIITTQKSQYAKRI